MNNFIFRIKKGQPSWNDQKTVIVNWTAESSIDKHVYRINRNSSKILIKTEMKNYKLTKKVIFEFNNNLNQTDRGNAMNYC